MNHRHTIAREIAAEGIALHAGTQVRMMLAPAAPEVGIVFRRVDLDGIEIPARYDLVADTNLGTMLERRGATVGVVEHLMAAVAGAGIDDLLVIVDGSEPPILDGDALGYLQLMDKAGTRDQKVPRRFIEVLKPVEVSHREGRAALYPSAAPVYDFEIAFTSAAIGAQRYSFVLTPDAFRREIAPARTFGHVSDLERLKVLDRGHGASLENTLAIDGDRVVNADLMRFPDEFVRHKILDAVGDMALAGAPLLARFEGVRSGHALNNALLRALFADAGNYRYVSGP
ncbi:MAG: UDP-3-O-[3-hydroxymyristoyl] N-acetylglucosamine deacetylase [Alphaproteobacteria bacterium]|nr:UDP-3-O-[3-hydroxymyristoyl] N-acetylglucosamine deacetylase [Alphaproteobacteria bacterium]